MGVGKENGPLLIWGFLWAFLEPVLSKMSKKFASRKKAFWSGGEINFDLYGAECVTNVFHVSF